MVQTKLPFATNKKPQKSLTQSTLPFKRTEKCHETQLERLQVIVMKKLSALQTVVSSCLVTDVAAPARQRSASDSTTMWWLSSIAPISSTSGAHNILPTCSRPLSSRARRSAPTPTIRTSVPKTSGQRARIFWHMKRLSRSKLRSTCCLMV